MSLRRLSRRRKLSRHSHSNKPKETIAGVIIAQMYQAQSDAKTHPDPDARERIITATNLVLDLLNGYTTPAVVAAIPRIQAILATEAL